MLKRPSLLKQSSRWETASLPKALLLVGVTAGVAVGGVFAYKRFTRQDADEWADDPMTGAADIYQGTDPPAI